MLIKFLPRVCLLSPVFFLCIASQTFALTSEETASCIAICDKQGLTQISTLYGTKTYVFNKASEEHIKEWKSSAVADDIIEANLISLPDIACRQNSSTVQEIFYPIQEFLGWTRNKVDYTPRVGRIAWMSRGLEPPSFNSTRLWGELKIIPEGSRAGFKYEIPIVKDHPRKTVFLNVSESRAREIFEKNSVFYKNSQNFWENVVNSQIPIHISEGTKKAASILSANYVGIGFAGPCGGMYTPDANKQKLTSPVLNDDILLLLKNKRVIYIAYDNDPEDYIKDFVNKIAIVFAELLIKAGAQVKIISLPGPEKGVDDFIFARGVKEYDNLVKQAQSYKDWRKTAKIAGEMNSIFSFAACLN